MDARDLKKLIESKKNDIGKTIALFYGEDYKDYVIDKVNNLLFYIYEDKKQQDGVLKVKLAKIAHEFAFDIASSFKTNDLKRKQIQKIIATIILTGSSLEEAELDDLIKEKVANIKEINDSIDKYSYEIKKLIDYYKNDYEVKEIYDEYKYNIDTNNMEEIIKDLVSKKFDFNLELLDDLKRNKCVGGNFVYMDESGSVDSFVIFVNKLIMYSSTFTDTCIHEIIHYLGGINLNISKAGLSYTSHDNSYCLEEAYTNYLASLISKEYIKRYGEIVDPIVEYKYEEEYFNTNKYMEFVFSLYRKELMDIQVNENINIYMARRLCPFDEMSYAVSRIIKADDKDVDRITNEEINKLKQISKR